VISLPHVSDHLFIYFVPYFSTLFFNYRLYSIDERVIGEWRIRKDVKRRGRSLTWGYILAYMWRDWGKPRRTSELPVFGPKFEPETSRIRSRSVNHSNTTLGVFCDQNFVGMFHLVFYPAFCYFVLPRPKYSPQILLSWRVAGTSMAKIGDRFATYRLPSTLV
jgi:hypothetical protein